MRLRVMVLAVLLAAAAVDTSQAALPAEDHLVTVYNFEAWATVGSALYDVLGVPAWSQTMWVQPYAPGALRETAAKFGRFGMSIVQGTVLPFTSTITSNSSWTLSVWMLPNAAAAVAQTHPAYLLCSTPTPGADPGFCLVRNVDNNEGIALVGASQRSLAAGSPWQSSGVGTFSYQRWTHITVTKTAANVTTLYVDGVQAGTSIEADTAGNKYWRLGGVDADDSESFIGAIDHLRAYNRDLTPAEVTQLYENDEHTVGPLPVALPSTFSAHISYSRSTSASGPGFTQSTHEVFEGVVHYDKAGQRSARHGVSSVDGGPYINTSIVVLEDTQFTIKTSESGTQCSATPSECPVLPETFACTPRSGFQCHPCAALEGVLTFSDWTGPPTSCAFGDNGTRTCTTGYLMGSTSATFTEDGAPVAGSHGTSSMTHQGSSSQSGSVTYKNMVTDVALPDDAFSVVGMQACLATDATCQAFCNNNADRCEAGACVCKAGWGGSRCDTPIGCDVPWGNWTSCSVECGVGSQSREATACGPTTGGGAPATEFRACNTQPCAEAMCTSCFGESSGPCRNPHDNVCHAFYEGTEDCPAGTVRCASNCHACVGGTVGPCRHDNDGTCLAYFPGTSDCPAGSTPCNGESNDPSMCTGCWPGTSGPCQQQNTVCWDSLPDGSCPVGTSTCAISGSQDPAPLAVADITLTGAGDAAAIGVDEQDAIIGAISAITGADPQDVLLESIRNNPATSPAEGDFSQVNVGAVVVAGVNSDTDSGGSATSGSGSDATSGSESGSGATSGSGSGSGAAPSAEGVAEALENAAADGSLAVALRDNGLEVDAAGILRSTVLNTPAEFATGPSDTGAPTDGSVTKKPEPPEEDDPTFPFVWVAVGAAALVAFGVAVVALTRARGPKREKASHRPAQDTTSSPAQV